MKLEALVSTSRHVASTRSRIAKRDALAGLLSRVETEDVAICVAWLAGELRQRRTGIGWAALRTLPPAASASGLTVQEVDDMLEAISGLAGPGSAAARSQAVRSLWGRATVLEQEFLRALVLGEPRQGALDSAVLDAVAVASRVPLDVVRRAVMLRGATGPVAVAALTSGIEAVRGFGLQVGQPVRPMLASSAGDVAEAFAASADGAQVAVDVKLDGIRIQVHKSGGDVHVYTRSLDDITSRLPEVVALVRSLPAQEVILDGEAVTLDADGRPRPFQETASRTASAGRAEHGGTGSVVTPVFFDLLHLDGSDLVDLPLRDRGRLLDGLAPASNLVERLVTADAAAARRFLDASVTRGQEGVVVKALDAVYDAGRRGGAWIKVKPHHTLDLVVLAVEWGSGRRQGWLSNIHLGARVPDTGGFVMLGKTFKGMTDDMLRWQTERFLQLEVSRRSSVVTVRPEQVVEVAFDGLQTSRRYAGGVALRFARVVRYRDDKSAGEADDLTSVLALGSASRSRGGAGHAPAAAPDASR
ncbi:MAG: ATP-dependent DNA ligase [Nocardioidaceae bacterium]